MVVWGLGTWVLLSVLLAPLSSKSRTVTMEWVVSVTGIGEEEVSAEEPVPC